MELPRTISLAVAAVVVCQPAPTPAPRHGPLPGRSGYVSDRGEEVHLRFEGRVTAEADPETLRSAVMDRVREASRVAGRDGPPIPVDAGDVDVSFPEPGRTWRADVAFVTLDQAPWDGAAPPWAYRGLAPLRVRAGAAGLLDPWVRIVPAPGPDPDRAPECADLASHGELRVVALFGQMEAERPPAVDQGAVSLRRLRTALESRGFAVVPGRGPTGGQVLEGSPRGGSGTVRVELVPPESLLLGDPAATSATLERATRNGDVVYFLGHSGQEALGVLSRAGTWPGARSRVLVLDSCWSFQRLVPGILAAAGPGLDVVSNPFRSYVGSVDSFAVLIEELSACADLRSVADPVAPWRAILSRMNGLAAARLEARLVENPSTPRRDRESYGVSRL